VTAEGRVQKIKDVWHSYHIKGCSKVYTVKQNVVFLSVANSLVHELKKLEVCYDLRKNGHPFITEAVCNSSGKVRDVVDLLTG